MSSVSLSRVSELIRCVIELLWNRQDGLSGRELLSYITDLVKLTENELGVSPSTNTPRYEKIIRLATAPFVKIGWLVKTDKGRWYLTDEGRNACRRFTHPEELYREALRLSEENKQDLPDFRIALEMMHETAWEYFGKFIRGKTSIEVAQLVTYLLEAMGFHVIRIAPSDKNRVRVDIVANVDPVGAKPYNILVQVKHKGQAVTVEGVKTFLPALSSTEFGLIFSTGGFTADAFEELDKGGYQKINAMDLEKFFDHWIRYFEKLPPDAHALLPLSRIYFPSPAD